MNDDTTKSEGWGPVGSTGGTGETNQAGANPPRVGFCQDCGKPLTQETLRAVGTGVFCEPCLTTRVGATSSAGYTAVPLNAAVPPPPLPGEPSPMLAAILGVIPGVGAMYNGQFAKGIVHLVIFGLLTFLSENVNDIFGLFVAGWMFYMIFEAYHTAAARRDGLPLPNAFGFNDIGERMGFHNGFHPSGKPWSGPGAGAGRGAGAAAPYAAPPVQAVPIVQPVAQAGPNAPAGYTPVNYVPVGAAPDWVGYVPPTSFSGNTAPQNANTMAAQIQAQAMRDAGFSSAPYAETYTGTAQPYGVPVAAAAPSEVIAPPEITARRIPTGAFWLIGLGVLILIANLLPDWKLTEQWWPPLLFAGLSVWLFTRRVRSGVPVVCILRWPVVLMVLAVMLALHAASAPVTAGLTFSVLLIAFGGLLLLERTAGANVHAAPPIDTYAGSVSGSVYSVTPPAEPASNRAAWAEPGDVAGKSDPNDPSDFNSRKGGE